MAFIMSLTPPCGKNGCQTQTSQTLLCDWELRCQGLSAGHDALTLSETCYLVVCLHNERWGSRGLSFTEQKDTCNLWCFGTVCSSTGSVEQEENALGD